MKLTVKDLKHNSHEFNDVNIEQTVGEFAEEVKKIFKFTDNVRLIYCGRILEHNKCLNEYFKEVNCGFIVCMAIKPQLITSIAIICIAIICIAIICIAIICIATTYIKYKSINKSS